MDPRVDSAWTEPSTVEGFLKGAPNPVLMAFATRSLGEQSHHQALDVGCGAGRNAVPLAQLGWDVLGVDLSMPMLLAAHARADAMRVDAARVDAARVDAARVDAARVDATCAQGACRVVRSTMDALPIPDEAVSLVIAHGIWNLAASDAEFRRAVREAARVSRPGAGLFVFTFSRHTIGPDAEPVAGESYVFTEFSGRPQCFLTEQQLLAELDDAGFDPDASVPLVEYNRPAQRILRTTGTPVIFEAAFRFRGRAA